MQPWTLDQARTSWEYEADHQGMQHGEPTWGGRTLRTVLWGPRCGEVASLRSEGCQRDVGLGTCDMLLLGGEGDLHGASLERSQ